MPNGEHLSRAGIGSAARIDTGAEELKTVNHERDETHENGKAVRGVSAFVYFVYFVVNHSHWPSCSTDLKSSTWNFLLASNWLVN